MNPLKILGRDVPLFGKDLLRLEGTLKEKVQHSRFLVLGGAGSVGQAVTRELFKRNPAVLHVVDISENNMVELVRGIRSTLGYINGDFRTFAVDCGSREFEVLVEAEGPYDYIFNLSALKHVRREKDPYTLKRMVEVNILNTLKTIEISKKMDAKKYFCVSTDKATNPINLMGASKRIMEIFLIKESINLPISTARFANVAFSDGSLLHGFTQRVAKRQPISAPNDIRRYFVTPQESGELCLISCILGENCDIFFPKITEDLCLTSFSDIARRYLEFCGYEPYECEFEDEARSRAQELIQNNQWPCYFFKSDTTGEKDFEEFYAKGQVLDMGRFNAIGIIKNEPTGDAEKLNDFLGGVEKIKASSTWDKQLIVSLFKEILPEFDHQEKGRYLDSKM